MALTAQHWTISGISTELKIDRRTIGSLIDENNMAPSKTTGKTKYYRMADIVAALTGGQKLDLQQEKAMESRERRRKLERENDIEERKVIPHETVVDVLQQVSKQAATIFDALPLNLKRQCPQLTARDIETVRLEIAKVRNAFAGIEVEGPR